MKAVVYLFSLWLIFLVGLPCPDTDCHVHENGVPSAAHSTDNHSHDHKAPCSPFCHCATCLGFAVPQPLTYTVSGELSDPVLAQQAFAYQSLRQSDVWLGIWQPPKL